MHVYTIGKLAIHFMHLTHLTKFCIIKRQLLQPGELRSDVARSVWEASRRSNDFVRRRLWPDDRRNAPRRIPAAEEVDGPTEVHRGWRSADATLHLSQCQGRQICVTVQVRFKRGFRKGQTAMLKVVYTLYMPLNTSLDVKEDRSALIFR